MSFLVGEASTPLSGFAGRKSPLSPANVIAKELKSDPKVTSELLRDINKALQSTLPSPAEYVRRLEAELSAAKTGGQGRLGGAGSAAVLGSDQSAKDLVASLERMLQQPVGSTPGRTALNALRQSQAAELGAGSSSGDVGGPGLVALPSFSLGSGFTSQTFTAAADVGAAAAAASASPGPSSWRLAAERATSFKRTPSTAAGRSSTTGSSWGEAVGMPKASPAADLLAEIDRVVSPSASPAASPAASPSFAHLAAAPASPVAYYTAPWQQQQQQQQTPAASPEVEGPTASRWNAVAASWPAGAPNSPGAPASPVTAFGFAAHSPGPAASLSPPSCISPVAAERVDVPAAQLNLSIGTGSRFDQEARQVLAELGQFGELERHYAADFSSRVAAEMGRLFALQSLPASQTACS